MLDFNGIGNANTVVLFDKNGRDIFAKSIDGNVRDAICSGNYIYVLRDTDVIRIDTRLGLTSYVSYTFEVAELQALPSGDVLLCTETTAYYLRFK